MSAWAVIVAGGSGERFGREGGKQLAEAAGRPLLAVTLEAFELAPSVTGVVLVCHPQRLDEYRAACGVGEGLSKVATVVPGGASRQASMAAGLAAVPVEAEVVLVHDGARPLVTPGLIEDAIAALRSAPGLAGVVVGPPVYDTLKTVGPRAEVLGTPDRSAMWVAQTPQVFRAEALRQALGSVAPGEPAATDDASLVERAGGRVRMFEGPRTNIKVTVPEDLAVVDALLRGRVVDRRGGRE